MIVDYLDRVMPETKSQVAIFERGEAQPAVQYSMNQAPAFSGLVALTAELPREMLSALPPQDYAAFVANEAAIREQLRTWAGADWQGRQAGLYPLPGAHLSPPAEVRRVLSKCPDVRPSTGPHALDFIADAPFREILIRDQGSMEEALGNNEWKSASVLAGSIIEALLLWALRNDDEAAVSEAVEELGAAKRIRRPLPRDLVDRAWDLASYILVAEHRRIISTELARGAELAKGFRNMIHPAAELRREQKPTREGARVAVGIVGLVAQDVGAWFIRRQRDNREENS